MGRKIYNVFKDKNLLSKESTIAQVKKMILAGELKKGHSYKVRYEKPSKEESKRRVKFKRNEIREYEVEEEERFETPEEENMLEGLSFVKLRRNFTQEENDEVNKYARDFKNIVQVIGLLAIGGQGKVYVVIHKMYGICILKTMYYDHPVYVVYEYFYENPMTGIQEVLEISKEIDNQFAVLLEFIKGETLDHSYQLTSVKRKVDVATELKSILENLHKHDIYHRDLKSNNVMIDNKGKVKIIDIGVCNIKSKPITWLIQQSTPILRPPVFNPMTEKSFRDGTHWDTISNLYMDYYYLKKYDELWEKLEKSNLILDLFSYITCLLTLEFIKPDITDEQKENEAFIFEILWDKGLINNNIITPEEQKNNILENKRFIFHSVYKKFFDTFDISIDEKQIKKKFKKFISVFDKLEERDNIGVPYIDRMPYLLRKIIPNSKLKILKGFPRDTKGILCKNLLQEYENQKGSLVLVKKCETTLTNTGYLNIIFPNDDFNNNVVFIEPSLIKKIEKYPSVIMEISIYKKGRSGHSNLLIIDKENKIISRFEPNGNQSKPEEDSAFLEFANYVSKETKIKFSYESTITCPMINFKLTDKKAVCDYISLMTLHFKLLNPEYKFIEIQKMMSKFTNLKSVVKKYLSYVKNIIDEVILSSKHIEKWTK